MAENVKISQLAKDLEIKSKDLIAIFSELGMTKQTGGTLECDEVSFALQMLMSRYEVENINDYIDGTYKVKQSAKPLKKPPPKRLPLKRLPLKKPPPKRPPLKKLPLKKPPLKKLLPKKLPLKRLPLKKPPPKRPLPKRLPKPRRQRKMPRQSRKRKSNR